MKKVWTKAGAFILAWFILFGQYGHALASEVVAFTPEQSNAIAMLNYITVTTQEVNASKNSRLYMENVYSSLINNTYPNAVDSRTLVQLNSLLDIMESYRMISVKRERLKYIFEQNQAMAIHSVIPSPVALLSGIQSYRPSKLIASIVYMAVDSISSYTSYNEDLNLNYIKEGWALDDEEAAVLHSSRKGVFNYIVEMVTDYGVPGEYSLTEGAVEELVKWENNDNIVSRIQFLESNVDTYKYYGGYWLILAKSYYNNGNYQKSIDAVTKYEELGTHIFRKDYEYAKVLPLVIASASEVFDNGAYVDLANRYAQLILDNTDHDDWSLRYFVAQTYVDLYKRTNDRAYLEKAYNVTLDNVNYLVAEQRTQNQTYVSPVVEVPKAKDATKSEKQQIDQYNKMLREARKTELPPVYEPLLLNCELLFALADEMKISESEKQKIEGILHIGGEPLFLVKPLDHKFWFEKADMESGDIDFEYGGTAIIIPSELVSTKSNIKVVVKDKDADASVTFDDWKIDKVERVTDNTLSSFRAVYTSEAAKNHSWKPDAQISIDIYPLGSDENTSYHFDFVTEGTKKEWYDYFKVWEGHKNNWYDYAKVWENSVTFKQVK